MLLAPNDRLLLPQSLNQARIGWRRQGHPASVRADVLDFPERTRGSASGRRLSQELQEDPAVLSGQTLLAFYLDHVGPVRSALDRFAASLR